MVTNSAMQQSVILRTLLAKFGKSENYTGDEIALLQIEQAVQFWRAGAPKPLTATLIGAADQLVVELLKQVGKQSFAVTVLQAFKDLHAGLPVHILKKTLAAPRNKMKHAGHGPVEISEGTTEIMIFIAILNYALLTGGATALMNRFVQEFSAMEPWSSVLPLVSSLSSDELQTEFQSMANDVASRFPKKDRSEFRVS